MIKCRKCLERPCLPSRFKRRGEHICSRCHNQTAANRAARKKYRTSAHGQAVTRRRNQRDNPRRIYVGDRYHSHAESIDLAQRINAHVKEQLIGFKQRQSARAHREDHPSR